MADTTTATWLPASASAFNALGDVLDALDVAYRSAAEFHYDQSHGVSLNLIPKQAPAWARKAGKALETRSDKA